jgi:hypothetical protein
VLVIAFLFLVALTARWWRRTEHRRVAFLGLAMILASYLLIYSARGEWSYAEINMTLPNWSRYHLFPQLGLTLFVVAGLPGRRPDALPAEGAGVSRTQSLQLCLLLLVLFVTQLPRSVAARWNDRETVDEQQRVLRRIDSTDSLCREYGIAGASARRVLGVLKIPPMCPENGWDFLRGSATPRALSDEEVRRLLAP